MTELSQIRGDGSEQDYYEGSNAWHYRRLNVVLENARISSIGRLEAQDLVRVLQDAPIEVIDELVPEDSRNSLVARLEKNLEVGLPDELLVKMSRVNVGLGAKGRELRLDL